MAATAETKIPHTIREWVEVVFAQLVFFQDLYKWIGVKERRVVLQGGCMYLDVRLEHSHFVDAAEEGEGMALEKFAQGSGVRKGVAQGGFAYF
jgi:hypothetical protein